MKIISVVGARPNFIKIAPFIRAVDEYNAGSNEKIEHILVHTGQHYDRNMSDAFFAQLEIPEADINLEVGSGTHAEQVGRTMIEFEKVLREEKPDWVVVVGDVNATLACSVTAKKENIKCCHIEAGLRSGDMTMPEEINRLVTDRISDLLLTPDMISFSNLLKEGIPEEKIRNVGNIMIDTLERYRQKASEIKIEEIFREAIISGKFEPNKSGIVAVTFHRPSNVDDKRILEPLVSFIAEEVSRDYTIVWPVHPRTRKMLETFGLWDELKGKSNLVLLHPLGYLEMLKLNMSCQMMITDSGGLQEECTVLGTPCLTMRSNTERPVTLREHGGSGVLVGNNIEMLRQEFNVARGLKRVPVRPDLWDGNAAKRCLSEIIVKSKVS